MLRVTRIHAGEPLLGTRGTHWMTTEAAFSRLRAAVLIPAGQVARQGRSVFAAPSPKLMGLLLRACRKNGPKSKG